MMEKNPPGEHFYKVVEVVSIVVQQGNLACPVLLPSPISFGDLGEQSVLFTFYISRQTGEVQVR